LREETRLELTGIQQRVGTTFLVVTHDQEEALGMASRIAVMNRGEVAQLGTPADIYERPNSRFVAGFVGAVNLFEGEIVAALDTPALSTSQADMPIPLPETFGFSVGTTAALAIRPEKSQISTEQPPGFALSATVASIGYQGSQSTIHLTTAGGMALRADVTSAEARSLERGMRVWVSWLPADAVILPR
jgi:putrescine transport system ATP-binding protein